MAFIDNRDLKVHTRHVHENFRPFSCEACDTAYKTKQGLTTHQKAHPNGECANIKNASKTTDEANTDGDPPVKSNTESKPFECPECTKRFSKKSRLEMHIRMHTNKKAFPCSINGCGKAFTHNQTLQNHMKQFHKDLNPAFSDTLSDPASTSSLTGPQTSFTKVHTLTSQSSSTTLPQSVETLPNVRELKLENLIPPILPQPSHQSSLNQNPSHQKTNNRNSKISEDSFPSGRDSVMSHMSDISTNSRGSIVVVEQRNLPQVQGANQNTLMLPSVIPTSMIQTQAQHLSSVSQNRPVVHGALGGVAAQLSAHNARIPSVAAKAAEAVFGRAAVGNQGHAPNRETGQGAANSWPTSVQINPSPHRTPVATVTSQFMPLNLQEALVHHQQQNPRLISNVIAQARSSSIHETPPSPAVIQDQQQSSNFQQMLQQQQHILLQQQQQEDQQRRAKEQKELSDRERERQVSEHERQQREQQEHYQRYQQQQLLQQQQQLAAAQAVAQVQQVQAQQSAVAHQAPSLTTSGKLKQYGQHINTV